MGKGIPGQTDPSLRGRITALERQIDDLAKTWVTFGNAMSQALARIDQRLNTATAAVNEHDLILEGTANVVGRAEVEASCDQITREASEKGLVMALEKGELVGADVVGINTTLVGVIKDKAGKVVRPGRVQLAVAKFKVEIRESLYGKKVGEVVDLPEGTLEISALYNDPTQPEAPPVDNEHVAPGAELFSDGTIDLNATDKAQS